MMINVTDRSRQDGNGSAVPTIIPLHFLFYRKENLWHAECLDLDLLTARPQILDAFRELEVEIRMYLETARDSGQWELYYPRRAPFSHWLKYFAASIVQEASTFLRNSGSNYTFRMPFDTRGRPIGA